MHLLTFAFTLNATKELNQYKTWSLTEEGDLPISVSWEDHHLVNTKLCRISSKNIDGLVVTLIVVLQDYTITIYLNQYWTDERLTHGNLSTSTSLTLTGDFADKIWVPDTFFANDKNSFLHDVTEKNKMIRLYGNGSVVYGMRQVSTY